MIAGDTSQCLRPGVWLDDVYRVERPLASGGFSRVYYAEDIVGAPLAIKEYFPATLARRAADGVSLTVTEGNAQSFQRGLRCFSRKAGRWPACTTRTWCGC